MRFTRILWQHRQPMIRFLGKRQIPQTVDHTPHVHPQSPSKTLPESFADYRGRATQHGPLGGGQQGSAQQSRLHVERGSATGGGTQPYGAIGGHSGRELGSVEPAKGQFWDRNDLPTRFRRTAFTEAEIEAIDSAGASQWA